MRSILPARYAAVTNSDTVNQGNTVGLFVGVGGNLVVTGVDGVQVTIVVLAGQYVAGKFPFVNAATTATGIVAAYSE